MSALTMLFLSILVFAVFLCSAAVTSFVAALTYPTVKQSLTFIRSGERSASLYIGFAIYGDLHGLRPHACIRGGDNGPQHFQR